MTIDPIYVLAIFAAWVGVVVVFIYLGVKLHNRIHRFTDNDGVFELSAVRNNGSIQQSPQNDSNDADERFRILAKNIPGVIYLCSNDENFTLIYTNEHISVLTGYAVKDFEDGIVSFGQLIHPDDKASVVRHINEMVEAGKPFELKYRLKHKKGHWIWVHEIGVGVFKQNRHVMLEGFMTDISDQVIVENALLASEEKLRKIVEKSNDGIYVIQGKRFVMINEKFRSIFGYQIKEVLAPDFTFMKLLDEESIRIVEDRRTKRERGETVSDRIYFIGRTKDNKKIHLEASVSNIEWDGKPAVLGILREVTEQKHLEEQLRHAQKLEAVGRLAGSVAHDFNNILTAINGYAELVAAKVTDEHIGRHIGEIIKASDRATKLIQQLLAFSRRQVIKPVLVNLNCVIGAMDSLLHRVVGENIKIETYFDENLGTTEIDPALVEQVIMNLVVNARDAMPSGGTLTIETFSTELNEEYCSMHPSTQPGEYVVMTVSDTGVGISEDIIDRIYEPFFTTKGEGKGTGLGLSTVYGIVKQSGGHIWCYSEIGQGAMFKIYLPRIEKDVPEIPTVETAVAEPVPKAKNETVLIAEDEESVRRFCSSVLSDLGYTVLQARDGFEALRLSQKYTDKKIDLLVTDMLMPGLNGKELAERLCKVRDSLKVIYMSGYSNNTLNNQENLNLRTSFIQKPFSSKTLGTSVRAVLDKQVQQPYIIS
jgi:two-component system, cell cycle sensor histidine kinase and response regulator CckA